MNPPPPFASAFPASTEADWRAAARRPGGAAEPRIESEDGIPVGPIYARRVGGLPIAGQSPGQAWRVIQRIGADEATTAAAECRDDVAGGASGLELAFAGSVHPLAGAIPADAANDVIRSLVPLVPEGFQLRVDAGSRTVALAGGLLNLVEKRGLELTLAFDPLAALAAHGTSGTSASWSANLAEHAAAFDARRVAGAVAIADGRVWHAGGASEVQELAATLATVVDLLRLLSAVPVERAMARIGVALAADTDQFLTVAKFRAARLLLGRMAEAAGFGGPPIPIHGETAWRTMSRRDEHMNVLRATGAVFAAAVGGADSIAVLPFDAAGGAASPAARRLARNTQTILAEEAHLHRFADPSAGSGAAEALTDALAEAAWERFQRIEAEGGMFAALRAGSLQREVAATRDARLARVRSGEMRMIGVNNVAGVETPPPPAPHSTARVRETIERLVFTRLSEDAERAP